MVEIKNYEESDRENEAKVHMINMCPIFTAPESWYRDLIHYLQQGYLPKHWSSNQRRALRLKSASYQVIEGVLFRKNYDGVLRRCLEQEDVAKVVNKCMMVLLEGIIQEIPLPIRS